MIPGDIKILAFSQATLEQQFGAGPAVTYLFRYLSHLGARAILAEGHYVDRHYLEDFSEYYARSFDAPAPSCKRYHFFADFDEAGLDTVLADAYADTSSLERSEDLLKGRYLGFVVRRPLASASVGRTVLKTYPIEGRRHYEVVRKYNVHIAGLHLSIDGLAYQQQDGGAAVCASTALWSSLQKVAHMSGHRTPTPSAITRAAASPFPASSGLTAPQMAAALSALGYIADVFTPRANRAAFRAKLVSCLNSHLPVILLVARKVESGAGPDAGLVQQGHAVAVTGYSEPTDVVEVPHVTKGFPPIKTRDASVHVIYVHDDNLGSHAHYELVDSNDRDEAGHRKLLLRRGSAGGSTIPGWPVDDWDVTAALVPKPSKLRLSVEAIFNEVWFVQRLLQEMIARIFRDVLKQPAQAIAFHFSSRFDSGVTYKRSLMDDASFSRLDRRLMREFQTRTNLPRHIGVVSAHIGPVHVCDFVLDVSEVKRDHRRSPVLALVGPAATHGTFAWYALWLVARHFNCPFICAAPSPPKMLPSASASP